LDANPSGVDGMLAMKIGSPCEADIVRCGRQPHFRLIGASKVQGSAGKGKQRWRNPTQRVSFPARKRIISIVQNPDQSSSPLRRITSIDISAFHLKAVFGHEIAALIRIPLNNLFHRLGYRLLPIRPPHDQHPTYLLTRRNGFL
jgi:hypothetical protein